MSAMSDLSIEWDESLRVIESLSGGCSTATEWALEAAHGLTDEFLVAPLVRHAAASAERLAQRLRGFLPLAEAIDGTERPL